MNSKYEPNQERINTLTQVDIDALITEYIQQFGVSRISYENKWVMSSAYRKGIQRGMQMAQEVDTLIMVKEDDVEEDG